MDFQLSDEQKMLAELAERLGREEFALRAARWDRNHEYPHENVAVLRRAGLLGMTIPKRFGGAGRPLIDVDLHMHTDHSHDCATPVEVLMATAREKGLANIVVLFENLPTMASPQLGAGVVAALTWLQDKPEHRALTTQLEMVALNLKNLK